MSGACGCALSVGSRVRSGQLAFPVRLWKVRVGRSSTPRLCGDAWAGPDPEGVTRGFVSRTHPGTHSGGGGCGPGPGGILLGALLPRKFPEVLLRLFPLVLKEPSPTLHLRLLWPGERRSGPRSSCPRIRTSLVRVLPSLVPSHPPELVLNPEPPRILGVRVPIPDPRLSPVLVLLFLVPRIPGWDPPIPDLWWSLVCVLHGSLSKPHWLSCSSTACPTLGS